MGTADPQNGVRQVTQNQSAEGLIKIGEDGRPTAWLAQSWEFTADGRTLKLRLRPGMTFHDGSAVTAPAVVKLLQQLSPSFMGPAFADVERITASGNGDIDIALRQRAPFVLEALEVQFRSPAPTNTGTGPFKPVGPAELQANDRYYLGRPIIDRLVVSTYPSARAAWAEMLRDHLDMLYEVGADALDSLERSNKISVFNYVRHYQYALIFNTQKPVFRAPQIRQAISRAIDRDALVRDALNGHGIPSSGPIWPNHWALGPNIDKFTFEPGAAARVLRGRQLHFTCLVPPDYERLALTLKRQLEMVNVSMDLEEAVPDRILGAMAQHDFDAVLLDVVSGPSLFRPFVAWHSGAANPGGFASPIVDGALERIRHAVSDDDYRSGVAAFQHAMTEDPPAIFLAWSQRARAVSKRFLVPDGEPGRDVLGTLRLWKPAGDESRASRN